MLTVPSASIYGAKETNGLVNGIAYHQECAADTHPDYPTGAYWSTPGLKVTRLRLLSDPGIPFWDVSYCHGVIDGKHVDVALPFSQLPKRNMRSAIIEHAKRDRVFAKGLGILENISTLI